MAESSCLFKLTCVLLSIVVGTDILTPEEDQPQAGNEVVPVKPFAISEVEVHIVDGRDIVGWGSVEV